jgi:hypothetical protein
MSRRSRGAARARGLTLVIAAALTALFVSIGLAAQVSAAEPTGDFAVFKQCPRTAVTTFPEEKFCLWSQTESGEVTIGTSNVPITKPITLQGGYIRNEETGHETFEAALNGETLSKAPQPVPGGLAGLIRCNEITEAVARLTCELVFQNGLTGVTATTELAKPASAIGVSTDNLLNEEGATLSLPAKVKLDNPLLGSACYIGTSASPVVLNLTDGTTSPPAPNKPITGKVGELRFKDEFKLTEITNNTLVDNAFSAPAVTGCGGLLAPVLDPVIDLKLGLPSAAGHNTAIQNNRVAMATAENVVVSEK